MHVKSTATNNHGETALYLGAYFGHRDYIKVHLGSTAAWVNIEEIVGGHRWPDAATPLHAAVHGGHTDVVAMLLEHRPGIDANVIDHIGRAPIHESAWKSHIDVIKVLLAAPGIHVNAISNSGVTALHSAAHFGRTDIVKYLLARHNINVNVANANDC